MRVPLWPQSLFWRLLAASVIAVLLAQAAALLLIAQEREHFVLQGSVREWTRRIAETTSMLQPMSPAQRVEVIAGLEAPRAPPHGPHPLPGGHHGRPGVYGFLRLPLLGDFEQSLATQLRAALGSGYGVEIGATPDPAPPAIAVPVPFYAVTQKHQHFQRSNEYLAERPSLPGRVLLRL